MEQPRRKFSIRLRLIAAGTVFLFSFQTVTWSSPEMKGLAPSAPSFSLPVELGSVEEFRAPDPASDAPFVIHIQDAHASPEAQEKIRDILNYLSRSSLVVVTEGARGSLHPEYLDLFPRYPRVNEAIVQDLVAKGILSGSELFAWENYGKSSVPVVGAENTNLYLRNLKAYRDFFKGESSTGEALRVFSRVLDSAEAKIFNPNLRKFLHEVEQKKDGRYDSGINAPNLSAYIRFLSDQAFAVLRIDLRDRFEQIRFPNLTRLLFLLEFEKKLYPRQRKILQSEIKAGPLFEEMALLEEGVLAKLTRNDPERGLLGVHKDFRLLEKLFHLELTREEYGKVRGRRSEIAPIRLSERLGMLVQKKNLKAASVLEPRYSLAFRFYHFAERRDRALLENALGEAAKVQAQSGKKSVVALITGGFHTVGLTALMNERRIPHAIVSPRLTRSDFHEVQYHDLMMGKASQLALLRLMDRDIHAGAGWLLEQQKYLMGIVRSAETKERLEKLAGLSDTEIEGAQRETLNHIGLPIARARAEVRGSGWKGLVPAIVATTVLPVGATDTKLSQAGKKSETSSVVSKNQFGKGVPRRSARKVESKNVLARIKERAREVRHQTAQLFSRPQTKQVEQKPLRERLEDKNPVVRAKTATELGSMKGSGVSRAARMLLSIMEDDAPEVRKAAVRSLIQLAERGLSKKVRPKAERALKQATHDPDPSVRLEAQAFFEGLPETRTNPLILGGSAAGLIGLVSHVVQEGEKEAPQDSVKPIIDSLHTLNKQLKKSPAEIDSPALARDLDQVTRKIVEVRYKEKEPFQRLANESLLFIETLKNLIAFDRKIAEPALHHPEAIRAFVSLIENFAFRTNVDGTAKVKGLGKAIPIFTDLLIHPSGKNKDDSNFTLLLTTRALVWVSAGEKSEQVRPVLQTLIGTLPKIKGDDLFVVDWTVKEFAYAFGQLASKATATQRTEMAKLLRQILPQVLKHQSRHTEATIESIDKALVEIHTLIQEVDRGRLQFPESFLLPRPMPKGVKISVERTEKMVRIFFEKNITVDPDRKAKLREGVTKEAYEKEYDELHIRLWRDIPIILEKMEAAGFSKEEYEQAEKIWKDRKKATLDWALFDLLPRFYARQGVYFVVDLNYKSGDLKLPHIEFRPVLKIEPIREKIQIGKEKETLVGQWISLGPNQVMTPHEFDPKFRHVSAFFTFISKGQVFVREDYFEKDIQYQKEGYRNLIKAHPKLAMGELLTPKDEPRPVYRSIKNLYGSFYFDAGLRPDWPEEKKTAFFKNLELNLGKADEYTHVFDGIRGKFQFFPEKNRLLLEVRSDVAPALMESQTFKPTDRRYIGALYLEVVTSYERGSYENRYHNIDLSYVRNRLGFWFWRDKELQQKHGLKFLPLEGKKEEEVKQFVELPPQLQQEIVGNLGILSDGDLLRLYEKMWDEIQDLDNPFIRNWDTTKVPVLREPQVLAGPDEIAVGEGTFLATWILGGLVAAGGLATGALLVKLIRSKKKRKEIIKELNQLIGQLESLRDGMKVNFEAYSDGISRDPIEFDELEGQIDRIKEVLQQLQSPRAEVRGRGRPKTFEDEQLIQAYRQVRKQKKEPLPTKTELAEKLGVTPQAVSYRLHSLAQKGIVLPVKEGKRKKFFTDSQLVQAYRQIKKQEKKFPTIREIADWLGVSAAAVFNRLRALAEKGTVLPTRGGKLEKFTDSQLVQVYYQVKKQKKELPTLAEMAEKLGVTHQAVSYRLHSLAQKGTVLPTRGGKLEKFTDSQLVQVYYQVKKQKKELPTLAEMAEKLGVTHQAVTYRLHSLAQKGTILETKGSRRAEVRSDRETPKKKLRTDEKLKRIRTAISELEPGEIADVETLIAKTGLTRDQIYSIGRRLLKKARVVLYDPYKKLQEELGVEHLELFNRRVKELGKALSWLKENEPKVEITPTRLSRALVQLGLEKINHDTLGQWLKNNADKPELKTILEEMKKSSRLERIKRIVETTLPDQLTNSYVRAELGMMPAAWSNYKAEHAKELAPYLEKVKPSVPSPPNPKQVKAEPVRTKSQKEVKETEIEREVQAMKLLARQPNKLFFEYAQRVVRNLEQLQTKQKWVMGWAKQEYEDSLKTYIELKKKRGQELDEGERSQIVALRVRWENLRRAEVRGETFSKLWSDLYERLNVLNQTSWNGEVDVFGLADRLEEEFVKLFGPRILYEIDGRIGTWNQTVGREQLRIQSGQHFVDLKVVARKRSKDSPQISFYEIRIARPLTLAQIERRTPAERVIFKEKFPFRLKKIPSLPLGENDSVTFFSGPGEFVNRKTGRVTVRQEILFGPGAESSYKIFAWAPQNPRNPKSSWELKDRLPIEKERGRTFAVWKLTHPPQNPVPFTLVALQDVRDLGEVSRMIRQAEKSGPTALDAVQLQMRHGPIWKNEQHQNPVIDPASLAELPHALPSRSRLADFLRLAVERQRFPEGPLFARAFADELKRLLTNPFEQQAVMEEIALLRADEARELFGNSLPAVMALLATLAPGVLNSIKDWDVDVYKELRAVFDKPGVREIFELGETRLLRTDSPYALALMKKLGDHRLVIPFYFADGPADTDGKAWFTVYGLERLGFPEPDEARVEMYDLPLEKSYRTVHVVGHLVRNGLRAGVPIIAHVPDRRGFAHLGYRFQILEPVPVKEASRPVRIGSRDYLGKLQGVLSSLLQELNSLGVNNFYVKQENTPRPFFVPQVRNWYDDQWAVFSFFSQFAGQSLQLHASSAELHEKTLSRALEMVAQVLSWTRAFEKVPDSLPEEEKGLYQKTFFPNDVLASYHEALTEKAKLLKDFDRTGEWGESSFEMKSVPFQIPPDEAGGNAGGILSDRIRALGEILPVPFLIFLKVSASRGPDPYVLNKRFNMDRRAVFHVLREDLLVDPQSPHFPFFEKGSDLIFKVQAPTSQDRVQDVAKLFQESLKDGWTREYFRYRLEGLHRDWKQEEEITSESQPLGGTKIPRPLSDQTRTEVRHEEDEIEPILQKIEEESRSPGMDTTEGHTRRLIRFYDGILELLSKRHLLDDQTLLYPASGVDIRAARYARLVTLNATDLSSEAKTLVEDFSNYGPRLRLIHGVDAHDVTVYPFEKDRKNTLLLKGAYTYLIGGYYGAQEKIREFENYLDQMDQAMKAGDRILILSKVDADHALTHLLAKGYRRLEDWLSPARAERLQQALDRIQNDPSGSSFKAGPDRSYVFLAPTDLVILEKPEAGLLPRAEVRASKEAEEDIAFVEAVSKLNLNNAEDVQVLHAIRVAFYEEKKVARLPSPVIDLEELKDEIATALEIERELEPEKTADVNEELIGVLRREENGETLLKYLIHLFRKDPKTGKFLNPSHIRLYRKWATQSSSPPLTLDSKKKILAISELHRKFQEDRARLVIEEFRKGLLEQTGPWGQDTLIYLAKFGSSELALQTLNQIAGERSIPNLNRLKKQIRDAAQTAKGNPRAEVPPAVPPGTPPSSPRSEARAEVRGRAGAEDMQLKYVSDQLTAPARRALESGQIYEALKKTSGLQKFLHQRGRNAGLLNRILEGTELPGLSLNDELVSRAGLEAQRIGEEALRQINLPGTAQIVTGYNPTVESVDTSYAGKEGETGSNVTDVMFQTRRDWLKALLDLLTPEARQRAMEESVLLLGPGRHLHEIKMLLKLFPNLGKDEHILAVVDSSWENLLEIKKELDQRSDPDLPYGGIRLYHADLSKMPFETGTFGIAYSRAVFDRTLLPRREAGKFDAWISELNRVLKHDALYLTLNSDRALFENQDYALKTLSPAFDFTTFIASRNQAVFPPRAEVRSTVNLPVFKTPLQIWERVRAELESHDPNVAKKREGYLPRLYHAIHENLVEIEEKRTNKVIDPEAPLDLFVYRDNPPVPKSHGLDRPIRVGFLPVAGNPLNWGHVLIALIAMNRLALDTVVFRIQGEIKYKRVPESDKVAPELRHALAEEVFNDFFPLFRYTDVGLKDDHEGLEGMFEFSKKLNSDKPIHFYYILGSETKQRTVSYIQMLYDQLKHFGGLPQNRGLDYILMQRGEYGRQLEYYEADELMKEGAKKAGVDQIIPVHVLRGKDVDLNIASTYYREGGDESIVPRKVHEFGLRHQRWGNRVGPDGLIQSRVEVFHEALQPMIQQLKDVIIETMERKPKAGSMGVFAFDGPSGAGKTSVVARLKETLLTQGLQELKEALGAEGYQVEVLELDLFLKPRRERRKLEQYVTGELKDPTGKIQPGIYLNESSFFRTRSIRKFFRDIQAFRNSGRKEETFVIKNPYFRRAVTQKQSPLAEYRLQLKDKTILLIVGKYAMDYPPAGFYDRTFRIQDNLGRNIALFQKRSRSLRPDEEPRQIVFYERALQPSYEVYAERTRSLIDYEIDLTRELFELHERGPDGQMRKRSNLPVSARQVILDSRYLYRYQVTTMPKIWGGQSFSQAIARAEAEKNTQAVEALKRLQSFNSVVLAANLMIHEETGRGILILGDFGMGKSRLSSFLHGEKGWVLGSDDHVQLFFVEDRVVGGLDGGIPEGLKGLMVRDPNQYPFVYSVDADPHYLQARDERGIPIKGRERFVEIDRAFILTESLPTPSSSQTGEGGNLIRWYNRRSLNQIDERLEKVPVTLLPLKGKDEESMREIAHRILEIVSETPRAEVRTKAEGEATLNFDMHMRSARTLTEAPHRKMEPLWSKLSLSYQVVGEDRVRPFNETEEGLLNSALLRGKKIRIFAESDRLDQAVVERVARFLSDRVSNYSEERKKPGTPRKWERLHLDFERDLQTLGVLAPPPRAEVRATVAYDDEKFSQVYKKLEEEKGKAPTIAELARKLGVAPQTVRTYVKNLETEGRAPAISASPTGPKAGWKEGLREKPEEKPVALPRRMIGKKAKPAKPLPEEKIVSLTWDLKKFLDLMAIVAEAKNLLFLTYARRVAGIQSRLQRRSYLPVHPRSALAQFNSAVSHYGSLRLKNEGRIREVRKIREAFKMLISSRAEVRSVPEELVVRLKDVMNLKETSKIREYLEQIAQHTGTAAPHAFDAIRWLADRNFFSPEEGLKRLEALVPIFQQIAQHTGTAAPHAFDAIRRLADYDFFPPEEGLKRLEALVPIAQHTGTAAPHAFDAIRWLAYYDFFPPEEGLKRLEALVPIAQHTGTAAPHAFDAIRRLAELNFFSPKEGLKRLEALVPIAQHTGTAAPHAFDAIRWLADRNFFSPEEGLKRLEALVPIFQQIAQHTGTAAPHAFDAIRRLADYDFFPPEEGLKRLDAYRDFITSKDLNTARSYLLKLKPTESQSEILTTAYVLISLTQSLPEALSPGAMTLLVFDLRDWEKNHPGETFPDSSFFDQARKKALELSRREKALQGAPTLGGKIHFRQGEMNDKNLEGIQNLLKAYNIYSSYRSLHLNRTFPMPEIAGFIYLPVTKDAEALVELADRVMDLLDHEKLLPVKKDPLTRNLWFQLTISGELEAPLLYITFANLLARHYALPEESWPVEYPSSIEAIGPLIKGGGVLEGGNGSRERHDDISHLYFYDRSTQKGQMLHDELLPQIRFWQAAELAYYASQKKGEKTEYEKGLSRTWDDFRSSFQEILNQLLKSEEPLVFKPDDRPSWPVLRQVLIHLSTQFGLQDVRNLRDDFIKRVDYLQREFKPSARAEVRTRSPQDASKIERRFDEITEFFETNRNFKRTFKSYRDSVFEEFISAKKDFKERNFLETIRKIQNVIAALDKPLAPKRTRDLKRKIKNLGKAVEFFSIPEDLNNWMDPGVWIPQAYSPERQRRLEEILRGHYQTNTGTLIDRLGKASEEEWRNIPFLSENQLRVFQLAQNQSILSSFVKDGLRIEKPQSNSLQDSVGTLRVFTKITIRWDAVIHHFGMRLLQERAETSRAEVRNISREARKLIKTLRNEIKRNVQEREGSFRRLTEKIKKELPEPVQTIQHTVIARLHEKNLKDPFAEFLYSLSIYILNKGEAAKLSELSLLSDFVDLYNEKIRNNLIQKHLGPLSVPSLLLFSLAPVFSRHDSTIDEAYIRLSHNLSKLPGKHKILAVTQDLLFSGIHLEANVDAIDLIAVLPSVKLALEIIQEKEALKNEFGSEKEFNKTMKELKFGLGKFILSMRYLIRGNERYRGDRVEDLDGYKDDWWESLNELVILVRRNSSLVVNLLQDLRNDESRHLKISSLGLSWSTALEFMEYAKQVPVPADQFLFHTDQYAELAEKIFSQIHALPTDKASIVHKWERIVPQLDLTISILREIEESRAEVRVGFVRKAREKFVIGIGDKAQQIIVTVVEVGEDYVRIGIRADKQIPIFREELGNRPRPVDLARMPVQPLQGGAGLVLKRYLGEKVFINGNIRMMPVKIRGKKVRFQIIAPGDVRILRSELLGSRAEVRMKKPLSEKSRKVIEWGITSPDSPLNSREKLVLSFSYGIQVPGGGLITHGPMSFDQVGEALRFSREWVRRIHNKAFNKATQAYKNREINAPSAEVRGSKENQTRKEVWNLGWQRTDQENQGSFGKKYPEIAHYFVLQILQKFEGKGKIRLADIGSSPNLFLSRSAQALLPQARIDAVDLASRDLVKLGPRERITYHEARNEKTGLARQAYDVVISTFSQEYQNMELSARELRRLLKKEGVALLLIHHPQSEFIEQIAIYQFRRRRDEIYYVQIKEFLEKNQVKRIEEVLKMKKEESNWTEGSVRPDPLFDSLEKMISEITPRRKNQTRAVALKLVRGRLNAIQRRILVDKRLLENVGEFSESRKVKEFFEQHGFEAQVVEIFHEGGTIALGLEGPQVWPVAYGVVLTKKGAQIEINADKELELAEIHTAEKLLRRGDFNEAQKAAAIIRQRNNAKAWMIYNNRNYGGEPGYLEEGKLTSGRGELLFERIVQDTFSLVKKGGFRLAKAEKEELKKEIFELMKGIWDKGRSIEGILVARVSPELNGLQLISFNTAEQRSGRPRNPVEKRISLPSRAEVRLAGQGKALSLNSTLDQKKYFTDGPGKEKMSPWKSIIEELGPMVEKRLGFIPRLNWSRLGIPAAEAATVEAVEAGIVLNSPYSVPTGKNIVSLIHSRLGLPSAQTNEKVAFIYLKGAVDMGFLAAAPVMLDSYKEASAGTVVPKAYDSAVAIVRDKLKPGQLVQGEKLDDVLHEIASRKPGRVFLFVAKSDELLPASLIRKLEERHGVKLDLRRVNPLDLERFMSADPKLGEQIEALVRAVAAIRVAA